ncbi:MAG: mercuric transport protein MerTP [Chitinophagaceae bacterium]
MAKQKSSVSLLGSGILLAIISSLCCIMPVLALVGSISGAVSAFSWIEPARPYLIILSIIVLTFAFYQAYKPAKQDDCDCPPVKKSFLQSKNFLWIVTIVSVILMTFPFYSKVFFAKGNNKEATYDKQPINSILTASIRINGMTCQSCESHINNELAKVNGLKGYETNYLKGKTIVQFDTTVVSINSITAAINQTGYKAMDVTLQYK